MKIWLMVSICLIVLSCQKVETYRLITQESGLAGRRPYVVAADQDNYWLGYRSDRTSFTLVNKKTLEIKNIYEVKLENGKMQSVNYVYGIIANNDYVWILSYENGLLKFNKKTQVWKLISFDDRPGYIDSKENPNRNKIFGIKQINNKIYIAIENYGYSVVDCEYDKVEIVDLREVFKKLLYSDPVITSFIAIGGELKFIVSYQGVVEKTIDGEFKFVYKHCFREGNSSVAMEEMRYDWATDFLDENQLIYTTNPMMPPREPLEIIVIDLNTRQVLEDDPYKLLKKFTLDKNDFFSGFSYWKDRLVCIAVKSGLYDVKTGKKLFSLIIDDYETYYYNLFIEDDTALINTAYGLVITKLDKKMLEEVK